MKFDLNQLKDIASQVPDLLSKGQQVMTVAQSILEPFQKSDKGQDTQKKSKRKTPPAEGLMEVTSPEKPKQSSKTQSSDKPNDIAQLAQSLSTPLAVAETLNQLIKQAGETMRFCDQQETIRTQIRSKTEVEIRKIDAMADMVRDYLNRSFDERAELFDNYFSVLDKALVNGDNTLAAQTLQSINSLAASSPFKDLADINKVTDILIEGGEWDI